MVQPRASGTLCTSTYGLITTPTKIASCMPEGLLQDILQGQSSGTGTEMYQRGGYLFGNVPEGGVDVLEMYQLMYQKGCTHPLGTFYKAGVSFYSSISST